MVPSDDNPDLTTILAATFRPNSAIVDLLITLSESLGVERVKPIALRLAAAEPEELEMVELECEELVSRDWSEWFLEQLGGFLAKAHEQRVRAQLGEWP